MNSDDPLSDRPDIVAATRGGDNSLGMNDEADPATASLEQAVFWRNIYTEILAMLLLVFILQDTRTVEISYFTATGTMSLGM